MFWLVRRSRITLRNGRFRAFRPNRRPNRPVGRPPIDLAQLRAGLAHELIELGAVVALGVLLQLRVNAWVPNIRSRLAQARDDLCRVASRGLCPPIAQSPSASP